MKNNLLFVDFNVNVTITISIAFGVVIGGTAVALYFIKNPDKLEKLVALFYKAIKWVYRTGEYQYIKYDIQIIEKQTEISKDYGLVIGFGKVVKDFLKIEDPIDNKSKKIIQCKNYKA